MNINTHTKTRSGFTLIELLTVIAIIGILAGILIPTIGVVRKNASKATSASNLRQIALGYNAFANTGPRVRTIANAAWAPGSAQTTNMQGWAHVVAEFGGLNDAALYFIDSASDVASITTTFPQTILTPAVAATPEWDAVANRISYDAAVNISPNARGVITPLVWTKNYDDTTNGWPIPAAPAIAPWEGDGGHIAFLDGHVVFYKTTVDQLSAPDGTSVDTIQDALVVGGTGPAIVSP